MRLKHLLERNDGGVWGEDPDGESDTLVLRSTDIALDGSWAIDDPAIRSIREPDRFEKRLAAGDLVVVKSSGSALHLGKTALVTDEVAARQPCFANFAQRLRPAPAAEPRYLWYLLNSAFASSHHERLGTTSTGLRNLNGEALGELPVPVSMRVRQFEIADFLDAETARIDALIEKKRRMIELLQERLRAMVMKELFGVGAHWVRLGRMVDLLPGCAFSSELFSVDAAGGVRLLRGINVAPGRVRWDETVCLDASLAEDFERYSLAPGDLVIGMDRPIIGGGMRVAEITETDVPSLLVQRVARLRVNELADRDWIRLALMAPAFVAYFSPIVTGVSVPHISPGQIQDFKVPLPQRQAQKAILQRLLGFQLQSARLSRAASHQIELLHEHRQALITAAVTGQLDVASKKSTTALSSIG